MQAVVRKLDTRLGMCPYQTYLINRCLRYQSVSKVINLVVWSVDSW